MNQLVYERGGPAGRRGICVLLAALVLLLILCELVLQRGRITSPDPVSGLVGNLLREPPFYCEMINKERQRAFRSGRPPRLPKVLVSHAAEVTSECDASRSLARQKLRHLGTNAWPLLPRLAPGLKSKRLEVRWAVADVCVGVDAGAAPQFEEFLKRLTGARDASDAFAWVLTRHNESGLDYLSKARWMAARVLARCDPNPAVRPQLLEYLRNSSDDYLARALVVEALGIHGAGDPEARAYLESVLVNDQEYPEVMAAACKALTFSAKDAAATAALIRPLLKNGPVRARVGAADALFRLGTPASELLPAVSDALGHRLPSIRCAALRTLELMGPAAVQARPAVMRLEADPTPEVRAAAQAALRSLGE